MKSKKNKIYYLIIILVLFGVSIGHAVMNRTLSITGNSLVNQNTWDIHFDNPLVTEDSVTLDLPTIDSKNFVVSFDVNLDLPGDFYEFTVDIVNDGTIDAMIDSIQNTYVLTEEQKKYLNYTITYQGGDEIKSK